MCISAVIFEYESEEQYLQENQQLPEHWAKNYL